MAMVNIIIGMDEDLEIQAEKLFANVGLNMESAFNLFVKQAVREQRVPPILVNEVQGKSSRKVIGETGNILQESDMATASVINAGEMIESAGSYRYSSGIRKM